MSIPSADLSHLHGADGSATCSANGYTVVGAVNGPIEVQRRDELPEEAALEINIRPAIGVGSMILQTEAVSCIAYAKLES
jgi:exosome complex component RRP46